MKRDLDLIRTIMVRLEESSRIPDDCAELTIVGQDPIVVSYHIHLLYEAGFIDAVDASYSGEYVWYPKRLTWHGHEFLDSARDEKIWRRAKDKVGSAIETVSLGLFQEVLTGLARKSLELI